MLPLKHLVRCRLEEEEEEEKGKSSKFMGAETNNWNES